MPIIINKLGAHKNTDAVENVIHYMCSSPFAMDCNGRGVLTYSPEAVMNGFAFTKQMYDKADRKQVAHLIIESQKEGFCIEEIRDVAEAAVNYFYSNGFQCFYVIHYGSYDNFDNMHVHLAVNTINYRDGKRLTETYSVTSNFRIAMETIFQDYSWHSVNDSSSNWE